MSEHCPFGRAHPYIGTQWRRGAQHRHDNASLIKWCVIPIQRVWATCSTVEESGRRRGLGTGTTMDYGIDRRRFTRYCSMMWFGGARYGCESAPRVGGRNGRPTGKDLRRKKTAEDARQGTCRDLQRPTNPSLSGQMARKKADRLGDVGWVTHGWPNSTRRHGCRNGRRIPGRRRPGTAWRICITGCGRGGTRRSALTVEQLYQSPEAIAAAPPKAEFAKSRGPNFV